MGLITIYRNVRRSVMLCINLFPLKSHKMFHKCFIAKIIHVQSWCCFNDIFENFFHQSNCCQRRRCTLESNSPFLLFIHSLSNIHTYIHIWMMQSYCLRNETFIHSLSLSPPWNEFQNLYLKLDIANTWCRWMDEICEGNRWNEMGLSHKMICFPFSLTSYHQVKWWYTWPFQLIVT